MINKALRLGFCLLAIAALSAGPTLAIPAPSFTYSQTGAGGTMEQACSRAIQEIQNDCDFMGPITTSPQGCKALRNAEGQIIGWVCTCTATTSYCGNYIGLP
jgi:hypothetical protein